MIFKKDLPNFNSTEEAFEFELNLARKKEYKIPYFNHSFRSDHMVINGKIENVLLSIYNLKQSTKKIDFIPYSLSILEWGENKYVLHATQHILGTWKTKFIEGLEHIPSMSEIEKIVKSEFR